MVALQVTKRVEDVDKATVRSLSARELDVLRFISAFFADQDHAPSLTDIADGLGETIVRTGSLIRDLERRNLVRRLKAPGAVSRSQTDSLLQRLVVEGSLSLKKGPGKPQGSNNPIIPTKGTPLTDYIIREREALRGS